MPQRTPTRAQQTPTDLISDFSGGYNGYTNPILLNPKAWAPGTFNVFTGQFARVQRARYAKIIGFTPATGLPFTSLKYFATPTTSAYLLADIGSASAKLFAYDTNAAYAQTQRLNPYVDPAGTGNSQLAGPWSREALQNIIYEMNGTVKQSGRGLNAATIEGWGLDAPDASPQVAINAGISVSITAISRLNGVVTATIGSIVLLNGAMFNVNGVTADPTFNGTFIVLSGGGSPTTSITWSQQGQNTTPVASGTVNTNITQSIGRSYAWAWENANKPHVSAPSPATQFIQYNNQNGIISLIEPGTITTVLNSTNVTGVGTFFTSAWVGRSVLGGGSIGNAGRIASVQSPTQLTLAVGAPAAGAGQQFQIFDPQATHVRLYMTADGQSTYFRVQRNVFNSSNINSLSFVDSANSQPPNFPYTTETSQINNVPPPIGSVVNEYQGRLCVYGITSQPQSFFYSNQETTNIGMAQESFAPLNQITLPIPNGKINGMLEFPGSLIIWSDKQDMFRLTGLLSDNVVSPGFQQGASVSRLPYTLGSAGPFANDITPLGGIWLTSNAEIWLYTDRYAPRNIGRPVQDILSSIPKNLLSLARARYYHTDNRNWFVLCVPQAGFNNLVLILDLDLLASNGSPSYFTFDMATNQPSWYVFQTRGDALEVVYESGGLVRLLTGSIDTITDIDFQGNGVGTELTVTGGTLITHAWGNDTAAMIKRPTFLRFKTSHDSNQIGPEGWTFQVWGIDDDFYDFDSPLILNLYPGPVNPNLPGTATTNDTSSLCGNPDLASGAPFRHSPELFRIGSVNFVAGRRLKFVINFPSTTGVNFQFEQIQLAFGANPPS